jgi:alpha-D-ribose 1-methylphosphonate 5-triphosphate synthase subunit PhnH
MPEPMLVTAPGLSDPVGDSQEIFRSVLAALSEPGRIMQLAAPHDAGLQIDQAALAVLLTLADGDTPIWIDAGPESALAAYLRFHTGAPIVTEPKDAQFALVADPRRRLPLSRFNPGTEDFPDRSTTVIMAVAALQEGGSVVLSGPGIPRHRHLTIDGLPPRFQAEWAENRAESPCGIDLLLTCGTALVGLPRSIMVEASCT